MDKTKIILIAIILILGGIIVHNYWSNLWAKQQIQIEESYQKGFNDGLIQSFNNVFDNVEELTTLTIEGKGLIILIPQTNEQ